jgi:hypothetical protein
MGFHPVAWIAIAVAAVFLWTIIRQKPSLQEIVASVNSFSDQMWAIIVILIGCSTLLLTKQYGMDSTAGTTIIGSGVTLMVKKGMSEKANDSEPKV